jgi:hypothetical protein
MALEVVPCSYTYVLKLKGEKWYVGKTVDPIARFRKHFRNKGPLWTRINPPEAVQHICLGGLDTEREITLDLIQLYGLDSVRGGFPYHRSTANYHLDRVPQVPTKHIHRCFSAPCVLPENVGLLPDWSVPDKPPYPETLSVPIGACRCADASGTTGFQGMGCPL